MEASGAGLSSGGDGAAQGEGQQQGGEGNGQGFDPSAITSTLDQLSSGQEELRQFLQSAPWASQQEQEADPSQTEEVDLSWLGDDQLDPQAVGDQLQKMIDQRAQEQMKPLMDRLNQTEQQVRERVEAEQFRDLATEFPELTQQETAQQVVQHAEVLAQNMGQPGLARNAEFIRLVYTAGRAFDAAQREGNAPAAANLEGASGASPGGQQVDQAAELKQLIVNGGETERRGAGVLNFGA